MPLLESAGAAIGMHVIPDRAAASADGGAQRGLDGGYQADESCRRQPARWQAGVDAGAMQALGRIDVAHADDDAGIHDGRLDGHGPAGQGGA